ncbi:glycosyltransferase family 61 protein [Paracoccus sp. (in: a-proteobacteria)]|uniref:glycosyltransferase family 61 protein n=1 Tax=Paracoccus sp. TaxID=267 RepID=UPI003220039C
MPLDLARPPLSVFHMPGVHPGLSYLPPRPGWVLRPARGARVRLFAESDDETLRAAQQAGVEGQQRRLLTTVMEIGSAPVVLRNAQFRNSFAMIDGRIWLNGAAGSRMRQRFDAENAADWRQSRLTHAFHRMRQRAEVPLPVWQGPATDMPVAIELKNGFNYYHFTTETLGSLAHFAADDSGQPIRLHLPGGEARAFVRGFVGAVFPALADRLELVSAGTRYDRVRSVYHHQHYLYQVEDARVAEIVGAAGTDPRWAALRPAGNQRKAVAMASFGSSLRLLREHALRQVPARMVAQMPRLVWMGRDEAGAARARGVTGHEALLAGLDARGFARVAFEHLSPLEPIAQMQAAEIVIAPHGAGLANMVYARPGALVIEIGTRQTQRYRWGDFLPCAHVSGCCYDTVFADISRVAPGAVPPISAGLLGVHIGQRATHRILSLVDAALAVA